MPYLTEERQQRVARSEGPTDAGDLTYLIQQQLQKYLMGRTAIRYEDLAVCLGAIEGAKLDFIERIVQPYEARKLVENGDVWREELLPQ